MDDSPDGCATAWAAYAAVGPRATGPSGSPAPCCTPPGSRTPRRRAGAARRPARRAGRARRPALVRAGGHPRGPALAADAGADRPRALPPPHDGAVPVTRRGRPPAGAPVATGGTVVICGREFRVGALYGMR